MVGKLIKSINSPVKALAYKLINSNNDLFIEQITNIFMKRSYINQLLTFSFDFFVYLHIDEKSSKAREI